MAESQTLKFSVWKTEFWHNWLPQILTGAYLLIVLTGVALLPWLRSGTIKLDVQDILAYCAGLIHAVCAVWVFWIGRESLRGRNRAILLASIGMFLVEMFMRQALFPFGWLFSVGLTGAALFALAILNSRDTGLPDFQPSLRLAGYGIVLLFYLLMLIVPSYAAPVLLLAEVGLVLLVAIFGLVSVLRWQKTAVPFERDRVQVELYAGLASYGPLFTWLVLQFLIPSLKIFPYLLLFTVFYPLASGFLERSERLWQTNFVLNRTAFYIFLAVLMIFGYALLVSGLALVVNGSLALNQPAIMGTIFFVLALLFVPLLQILRKRLDRVFFRGERDYEERLQAFGNEMTGLEELEPIIQRLRDTARRVLYPESIHIYLFDPQVDQYCAVPDSSGERTSDLHFPENSALASVLFRRTGSLLLHEIVNLPPALQGDNARMRLLGAVVYVPLAGQQHLNGWLALGPHQNGEAYTARELNFLDSLCDQAALAIERAQVAARMDNRAREMAVLTRLAQGINITLSFDDILELIYAQTSQIIPLQDFSMLLIEPESGLLMPAIAIEQDERIAARENQPLAASPALVGEVVRQRKPLLAEDYSRECQKYGCLPQLAGLHAWMAVPLNAGAEIIGVLEVAARDSSTTYSVSQLSLLQSVADQAAGAIVKTRLLHEAERRACQLTSLNEVTRKLTSTLELNPLLKTILNSAVDILNCVAGSLLLVDDERGELIFQVTVGPVADDLAGKRMPLGTGLVGKAVQSRQSVIVNNVRDAPEWFPRPDQQTGFLTRAVLVTPLVIKDQVIGVIEVINRKDGLPFGKDDGALLEAFAAQAAVAIENARLYTMTDLALAARVEELSVMQRIDRELNASLDTTSAMDTTLGWAMRQSGAAAGLVAALQGEDQPLRIMSMQGYSDELNNYHNGQLPVEVANLKEVLEDSRPCCRSLAENAPEALLHGARTQMVIAIQREEKVIGVLLLESPSPVPIAQDTLNFLVRLSDHASIAISNAQLYAAVQAANVAKSEFVSFVSHELKNPMTSVKGFTDLLAAGAVGPINETQANFLSTIRSNVDRINTLISDLNDMSKIEANRLRLDFKGFSLADSVEEVARSTRRQIEEKSQTLVVLPLGALPKAWADRTRVVQVLVNLISNANKYTDKGGEITLGAEACENQWDSRGVRQVIHIWVRDNGIGISEPDQKKIFQKFFRSDDPKTREANGTGLGLNITKSLVEMQGGQIWFESAYRQGTTFHFTLPIAE